MLSDAELASMRADVAPSMPETCSILQATTGSDGMGGITDLWVVVYSDVPCRMASMIAGSSSAAIEDNIAGRIAGENIWLLTLAWDQPLSNSHRILFDARTFEITYIGADRTWQILKRIGLVELA